MTPTVRVETVPDTRTVQDQMLHTSRAAPIRPSHRVHPVQITLERIEGPLHEIGRVATFEIGDETSEDLWNRAADELALWGHSVLDVGSNTDRCDYVITFADGESYSGFYFLAPTIRTRPDLRRHLQAYLEHNAGRCRYPHLTEKQYQGDLVHIRATGLTEQCAAMLDTYAVAHTETANGER